jgi:5'-deoxynucleotidase
MKSHFFAILARMKFIRRWGLMRNTQEENIQEHTLQTAMIAYHLCVMRNTYFAGHVDPKQAAVLAMYHDATEVYTGDMPTPIKYFNSSMRQTYGEVEELAQNRLLSALPPELRPTYEPLIKSAEQDPVWPLVKAADTLSAYLKCMQEKNAGNREFDEAIKTIRQKLDSLHLPEVDRFLAEYSESFLLTIDEINKEAK